MTPVFKGISIEYNSPPILTLGQVDKAEGLRTTWFEYSITYTDVDNDEPSVRLVYIDGVPYQMSSPDQDFTDGAVFSYTTRLGLGEHDYYFEFSDGKNPIRDPPGGAYTGPEVLNQDPVPIIDFPGTGERPADLEIFHRNPEAPIIYRCRKIKKLSAYLPVTENHIPG